MKEECARNQEDKLRRSYRVSIVFGKTYTLCALTYFPGPHLNVTLQALMTLVLLWSMYIVNGNGWEMLPGDEGTHWQEENDKRKQSVYVPQPYTEILHSF